MSLGLASPLLLFLCVGGIVVVAVAGWMLFKPEDKERPLRIAPLAPLSTVAPTPTPAVSVNPVPAGEAAVLESAAEKVTALESAPETEAEALGAEPPPAEIVEALDLPPGSVNATTQEGVATRFVVPKLELDTPVVISRIKNQTWEVEHLGQSVGHLEGTAAPGSNSNIVLAGHVTLSAGVYGPFAGLGKLARGDIVSVYKGDQKFDYAIDSFEVVERTAVEVTFPTDSGQLTLITCNNWNAEASRYEKRLIVRGHLVTE